MHPPKLNFDPQGAITKEIFEHLWSIFCEKYGGSLIQTNTWKKHLTNVENSVIDKL